MNPRPKWCSPNCTKKWNDCRDCRIIKKRLWNKTNAKAQQAYRKKYREENIEFVTYCTMDWRRRNPGKVRAMRRRDYLKNKKRYRTQNQIWRKENPERYAFLTARYESLKRATSTITVFSLEDWRKLCKAYNNKCAMCRNKRPLEQDHIIPLSKEGVHSILNIQPLCRSCNSKKSNNLFYRHFFLRRWSIYLEHGI